ncbi:MAG: hypothetical protein HY738_15430 [Bacteroidia bacterium]|nr:hypothetical protein [Bacteroidia bacterium]
MNDFIGIVDFRNIIKAINETHGLDLSDFAFTSLKRRFERLIILNNLNSSEELIEKIRKEKNFFEIIMDAILVDETEMFRDPSMWRELRDKVLPLLASNSSPKIWVACATSGEELLSLAIVLRESNLDEKVNIIVTTISENNIYRIKRGIYDSRKIELYDANYRRYNPNNELSKYFSISGNRMIMSQALLQNTEFIKHCTYFDELPAKVNLVLYRNKMIYFNQSLAGLTVKMIDKSVLPGGFFIIGIKEFFDDSGVKGNYIPFNKTESIYRKRNS